MQNKEIPKEGNIKFLTKSNKTSTGTFNFLRQKYGEEESKQKHSDKMT
jgi:hypothetical protein